MSYSNFFSEEFSNIELGDKRLEKRAISIGNSLVSSPGSCIQEVFATKNEARRAYDFNPKVGWLSLFKEHQNQTIKRISNSKEDYVYVIQDSTYYNYSDHKAKIDIGVIGKQGSLTQFGFLQHTALCVSSDSLPLGISKLDFIGYEDDCLLFPHRQGFSDVASSRWRRFLTSSIAHMKCTNANNGLEIRFGEEVEVI